MPGITWDINLTTIFVFAGGCVAFYLGVLRTGDKVRANAALVSEVQKAVEGWKLEHLALRAEHQVLKEEVHTKYLPRSEFDSTVDRLFDKIEDCRQDQIKAINRVDDRLVEFITANPPPAR
jgi:hypothetical protein